MASRRQHTLSIDDAPFDKFREKEVLLVGVVTAGGGLVEGVMTTRVPVDGDAITERLARWVLESRFRPSLRSIVVGGITMAGLAVIDLPLLHRATGLAVIAVERKVPEPGRLQRTLRQLGFNDRLAAVAAAGEFQPFGNIVFTCAGVTPEAAREILEQNQGRSRLPEGLRLAHLLGQGIVLGESKGAP
jgi:hypothetical protein